MVAKLKAEGVAAGAGIGVMATERGASSEVCV